MYPGNHTESEILSVPRNLKTRPGAPETHLAYITDDESDLLEIYKPDTPHKGPHDVPNYDSWDWEGGSIAEGGGWASGSGSSSEQQDYGSGPDLGGAGSTTDWSGSISNEEAYTPPEQIYGPGQATPGETGYAYTTLTPGQLNSIFSGTNLSPETLAFFGYTPGSLNVPNELLAQLTEGSIVSGNEADLSNEPNIGTWSDMESNIHPLMGYNSYLDIMDNPFVIPITGGSSGGPGPHYGGSWNYGGGGGSRGSGGGSFMQYPSPYEGGNPHRPRWGQSGIQRAWIDRMKNPHIGGYNRGGIVSLC